MAEEENAKPQTTEVPQTLIVEMPVEMPKPEPSTNNVEDPNGDTFLSSWHQDGEQSNNVSASTSIVNKSDYKKPFLGGYLHRKSGTEYHHAFTQTPALPTYIDSSVETLSSFTQTVQVTNQSQQTNRIIGTQFTKIGVYVSCANDKVITPRRYVTADEVCASYMKKLIMVQSYVRRFLAKKKVSTIRTQHQGHLDWVELQRLLRKADKDNRMQNALFRQQHPRRRGDFDLLYNSLEKWRQEQLDKIGESVEGPERKAALCLMVEREQELLNIIHNHKLNAADVNKLHNFWNKLCKTSIPKAWRNRDGVITRVYTANILRAKHLQDLYQTLTLKGLSEEERLDSLVTLKDTIKCFDTPITREIADLADREADLLVRGVKVRNLEGLHHRILILYMQCIRTPLFNPEYGSMFKPPREMYESEKQVCCESCGLSYPPHQFVVTFSSHKFGRCRKCLSHRNEAHERTENSLYRFMLSHLRKAEEKLKAKKSVALLLEEQDFRYLVEVIWNAQSALSNIDDLYVLVVCRWIQTRDWTPWNCIVLTAEEASLHIKLDTFEQVYSADFIETVKQKQMLAKKYFLQISHPKPKVSMPQEPETLTVLMDSKPKRCDLNLARKQAELQRLETEHLLIQESRRISSEEIMV